jgi:hypothetical protein
LWNIFGPAEEVELIRRVQRYDAHRESEQTKGMLEQFHGEKVER